MYPQSKPITATDALRNPQRPKPQVRRQGSVGMGGGMSGGVKPMGGSPYPPAPRPMQPQRPQGVPAGTQLTMQPQPRPTQPTAVPYQPTTAVDALRPPQQDMAPNIAQQQAMIESKVSQIQTMDQFNAAMTQANQLAMSGDPNAQMVIAALIKRFQSLQSTATPQPYTPNPSTTNQSQY